MDIQTLLKSSEGKTLEFKRDMSSPLGIMRTMIAFANTAGGVILVGVEDKTNHVCGIKDPLAAEEKLANLVSDYITPQLLPEVEIIPWRNTYLLKIQIFPSSTKPHYLKQQGIEKGSYIRVGSTNRLADKTMILELQRVKLDDSFDRQPLPELNFEALDFKTAAEVFADTKNISKHDLETLDVITSYQGKKVPTIGGEILFGKDRLKFFPDAWIQVGRFMGTTKTTILDTQEITTYFPLAIESVMDFVKKHAARRLEITAARHTEIWNIPFVAVREALMNAVVHADYSQQGSPIRLAIFDDRIEIENPGLLLFGLTVDEIKQGISKIRNRVIAQVFYRLRLIEQWGSGIKRIIDSCIEAGFSEPKFEEIGTHFRVTLFTQSIQKPEISEIGQMILEILRKNDGLSTREIAAAINKSQRTARLQLIALVDKGLVAEVGKGITDPGRKYFIKT